MIRVREESEKAVLKLNIQKTQHSKNSTFKKLTSWHPVPSLHGNQKVKSGAVTDFILGGYKITVHGDCSHEVKRHLLLVKKSYNKPTQHIKS